MDGEMAQESEAVGMIWVRKMLDQALLGKSLEPHDKDLKYGLDICSFFVFNGHQSTRCTVTHESWQFLSFLLVQALLFQRFTRVTSANRDFLVHPRYHNNTT